MAGYGHTRDPLSLLWDAPAKYWLGRAISARGSWVGSRLADPTPERRAQMIAKFGIDPMGNDTAKGRAARTRWARAFVRSVHYHAKMGDRPVQVEIGRHLPALGVIPAGRAFRIRVRLRRGARAAAERLPVSKRIYDDSGAPGGRWADPALRDW